MDDCPHLHVHIETKLACWATLYLPAEYDQRAVCDDCGKVMDVLDIPEDCEVKE